MMEFNLKFDEQDIKVLGAALGEMPAKVSMPLIGKINQQIAEQLPKVEVPDSGK